MPDRTISLGTHFEIMKTPDGRIFGIKNMRQEFAGVKMTLKADIAGDREAGKEYLDTIAKKLLGGIYA